MPPSVKGAGLRSDGLSPYFCWYSHLMPKRTNRPDTLRMIFGYSLLIIVACVTVCVALGRVEEKTSYGLMPLLTMLSALAGAFANYAFSRKKEDDDEDDRE